MIFAYENPNPCGDADPTQVSDDILAEFMGLYISDTEQYAGPGSSSRLSTPPIYVKHTEQSVLSTLVNGYAARRAKGETSSSFERELVSFFSIATVIVNVNVTIHQIADRVEQPAQQ